MDDNFENNNGFFNQNPENVTEPQGENNGQPSSAPESNGYSYGQPASSGGNDVYSGQEQQPQNDYSPYSTRQPQSGYGEYQYGQYGAPYTGSQFTGNGGFEPPVQNEPPKKDKKAFKFFMAAVALILVFALGVCTATVVKYRKGDLGKKESETVTRDGGDIDMVINDVPAASPKSNDIQGSVLSASEIAEKCRKSNVGIIVYSKNSKSSSAAGEGSGIVMGIDSTKTYTYIITCAHVIDDKGVNVTVQTEDGTSYNAEIIGFDTKTDIGVLRVKTTALTPAEFGNSDKLGIGDPVCAIGNPGGVDFFGSFTGGFISAINRPVNSEIGYTMKCIQHDAAINPGNSGGMLVNKYGQVIGINSQKIASSSYEGMGFAIPITAAQVIINDLIDNGYVPNRPMLGITYYSVSASTQYSMIAQIKGLPAGTLIINSISSESSLADTKVRKYDMITAVNGKDLDKADVLLELIDNGKVGDKLTLSICRVNSDYSIEEFDVECKLVEDKGTGAIEEETTQVYLNPFDYFSQFGY